MSELGLKIKNGFGPVRANLSGSVSFLLVGCLLAAVLTASSCSELEKPEPEPYYAETAPPPKQEFRWSNGKMPGSFDPARAAAPPETDIVRAVFEGLTDTDPKTLEAIPAVAVRWSASTDNKTWTFELRRDARWSNNDPVTAEDFVRSWKRLAEMGDEVSHKKLLNNIVGLRVEEKSEPVRKSEISEKDLIFKKSESPKLPLTENTPVEKKIKDPKKPDSGPPPLVKKGDSASPEPAGSPEKKKTGAEKKELAEKIGVEAIGRYRLKVKLIKPDAEFPALVAHPIFRPVHEQTEFVKDKLDADVITNGAFRIASVGTDGVTLDRAENYWNRERVKLERVRFVPQESAEKALEDYRAGRVDAVTNADFEPLALKLLEPYEDFRRTVHSALNFYEFNRTKAPYHDRRVREALAISIERERLTDGDMDGASKPALGFLPYAEKRRARLSQDNEKARALLTAAGFPDGKNFPTVRLFINRNNVQQKIARSVARMWKQNLNIETEIVVKENEELEEIKKSGEFDVIRRGVVLPTSDETANMLAIFSGDNKKIKEEQTKTAQADKKTADSASDLSQAKTQSNAAGSAAAKTPAKNATSATTPATGEPDETEQIILTEEEAILELPAIPLYFPTSYSLVKPYVEGFDINTLDAPSLKDVRINNFWQPKKTGGES